MACLARARSFPSLPPALKKSVDWSVWSPLQLYLSILYVGEFKFEEMFDRFANSVRADPAGFETS